MIKIATTLALALALSGAAAPALAQTAPRLAANVKPAPAPIDPVKERLVAANPTPIFTDLTETGATNGELKLGEPVQALGQVRGWEWIVVGKDGVGVGYVPRSLLKPANS